MTRYLVFSYQQLHKVNGHPFFSFSIHFFALGSWKVCRCLPIYLIGPGAEVGNDGIYYFLNFYRKRQKCLCVLKEDKIKTQKNIYSLLCFAYKEENAHTFWDFYFEGAPQRLFWSSCATSPRKSAASSTLILCVIVWGVERQSDKDFLSSDGVDFFLCLWPVCFRDPMVTMQTLTPHVYWAQRHKEVYLRVELSDAKVRQTQHQPGFCQSLLTHTDLKWETMILKTSPLNLLNTWGATFASLLIFAV